MASSAENKSFCEVSKYVPKVDEIYGWIVEIDELFLENIPSTKIIIFLNLKH